MLVVMVIDPGGVVYKNAVWKYVRARKRHLLHVDIFKRGSTVWVLALDDGVSYAFAYNIYLKAREKGLEASLQYARHITEDWIPEKVRQAAEKWLSQDLSPADAIVLKGVNITEHMFRKLRGY